MKRLAGGGGNIDLDLGCLWELTTGHKGVVQALGNAFGDLDGPPFVKLDKDDRSGAATDGENLLVSGGALAVHQAPGGVRLHLRGRQEVVAGRTRW